MHELGDLVVGEGVGVNVHRDVVLAELEPGLVPQKALLVPQLADAGLLVVEGRPGGAHQAAHVLVDTFVPAALHPGEQLTPPPQPGLLEIQSQQLVGPPVHIVGVAGVQPAVDGVLVDGGQLALQAETVLLQVPPQPSPVAGQTLIVDDIQKRCRGARRLSGSRGFNLLLGGVGA